MNFRTLLRAASDRLHAFQHEVMRCLPAAMSKEPAKFRLLAQDLSFEPYALARGDSALRLEVNRALTQVYTSPDIEAIFAKWMGKLGRPGRLLTALYLLNSIPE